LSLLHSALQHSCPVIFTSRQSLIAVVEMSTLNAASAGVSLSVLCGGEYEGKDRAIRVSDDRPVDD
jgi:hypothetical protein